MELTLRINGEPEPERRHRSRIQGAGGSAHVQTYSHPDSRAWRDGAVAQLRSQLARAGLARTPLCGPVQVLIVVRRTRPRSYPASVTRDVKKPDWDNYAKAVCDALTEAGVWFDDGCVDDARVLKRFADAEHPPGVDVLLIAEPPQSLRF